LLIKIDDKPLKKEIQNLKLSLETLKAQLEALLSQKEALKTAYKTAYNTYLRNKKLYQKKAFPKEKLELSYSAYKKAEAQYKQILANIKDIKSKIKQTQNQIHIKENELLYLEIKAPINGIVSKVFLKEGNIALTGKPLIQIFNEDKYKLLIQFPQNLFLKEKSKVLIPLNETKYLTAFLEKIYPAAEKNNLYIGEVVLNSLPENVKPFSFLHIKAVIKEAEGFIVPKNAILHLSNGIFLLTEENRNIKSIPIKILAQNEKYAVVEGNINENMIVAIGDESKLRLLFLKGKGKILKQEDKNG